MQDPAPSRDPIAKKMNVKQIVSNLNKYLPIFISIISVVIAYISFERTKIFQEYEYASRLQVCDDQLIYGHEGSPNIPALSYSSKIENRGTKTIDIISISLDYGDRDDPQKRIKYIVEGEIFLAAGKDLNIHKDITWKNIEEMKKRFNINQALFFLHISYQKPGNRIGERLHALGGFDGTTGVIDGGTSLC